MDLAEYKGVYVIAEEFEGKLRNVSLELLGQGKQLADGIGDEIGAVLIGHNVKPLAQELIAHGARKVYVYDDPKFEHYNTTAFTKALVHFFNEVKPNVYLVGATNIGRDLGPRVANSLQTGLTADCTNLFVDDDGKTIVWTRPALGGNIMAEIVCRNNRPQMGTVRPNVFKKPMQMQRVKLSTCMSTLRKQISSRNLSNLSSSAAAVSRLKKLTLSFPAAAA